MNDALEVLTFGQCGHLNSFDTGPWATGRPPPSWTSASAIAEEEAEACWSCDVEGVTLAVDGDEESEEAGPDGTSGLAIVVCCVERGSGEAAASHETLSSSWTEQGSPLYGVSRISTD